MERGLETRVITWPRQQGKDSKVTVMSLCITLHIYKSSIRLLQIMYAVGEASERTKALYNRTDRKWHSRISPTSLSLMLTSSNLDSMLTTTFRHLEANDGHSCLKLPHSEQVWYASADLGKDILGSVEDMHDQSGSGGSRLGGSRLSGERRIP